MGSENDLIQKLMISKKIMDKHNSMSRNQVGGGNYNITESPEVENFNIPQASYNIPQEFMMESKPITQTPKVSGKEKILSSKLPDEIKKLMIEHPISQPNGMQTTVLSDDIVEKASRLMNVDASGKQIGNPISRQKTTSQQTTNVDSDMIRDIVRETVREVLSENGLLVESTSKSNDIFSFKVGKHIFEGKVTKIKKIRE